MCNQKCLFFFVILLFAPFFVCAQIATSSPYSSRGIGLWEDPLNGVFGAMGGARISIVDSTLLNDYNPASYSYLGKGMPLFAFDVNARLSNYSSATQNGNAKSFYIKNIAIAIPFANRFGLTLGIKPVSKRGYNFADFQLIDGDTVKHTYIGNGQVQEAYLGFCVAPIKTDKHFLSLGFNGGFDFGSISNNRAVEFLNNTSLFNAASEIGMRIRAFGINTGVQYRFDFNETNAFSVGLIYQPQLKWNATKTELLYRFAGVYGVNNGLGQTQTLYYNEDEKGSITLPQRLGAGITWEFKGREDSLQHNLLRYRLRISIDYERMSWSKYSLNFANASDTSQLSNANFFRLGVEYTPHLYFNDSKPNIHYFSKVHYRVGFRYAMQPTPVNVLPTKDMSVTFGLGFPLPIRNSSSSINFGVCLGQQGVRGANSIQEKYLGIQLGIILSPGSDRWFRRYKYN
jgi:hypothetical protein